MSSGVLSDEILKKAVISYCEALCASEQREAPVHSFSELYSIRIQKLIAVVRRRRRVKQIMRNVLVAAVCMLIIAGAVVVSSPTAYAAVRSWTINIYNKLVDYTFNHTEDDHAAIICAPADLPEGFELAETYHSGYYTRKLYKNSSGSYIRLEYRKPTDTQKARIEKRSAEAERVTTANGVPMSYLQGSSKNELFWYDADRSLVFSVESNLDKDALLDCFSSVSYRLPLYEPTWLPEGYKEVQRMEHYPYYDIIYAVSDLDFSQHVILYSYCDIAETDGVVIDRLGDDVVVEGVRINGILGKYYPHTDGMEGGDFILINEKDKLIYMIESDLDKNLILRLAESIMCVEESW